MFLHFKGIKGLHLFIQNVFQLSDQMFKIKTTTMATMSKTLTQHLKFIKICR